jgi:Dolichyl-phosphate-mannose-protein mannosyltransferase
LEAADIVARERIEGTSTMPAKGQSIQSRAQHAVYAFALLASISLWFIAIRAPLWLDETSSYWQIKAGFWQIPARQGVFFAAYSYILWFFSLILGTSEIALRIPSILAMLGAVYLLYRSARELFDQDTAIIAAVIFALHPIVIFASIDVRPYAFAALAINAAIYTLVRLRNSSSNWLALAFGLSAACIVYFQLLFSVLLPSLLLCFFANNNKDRKTLFRQFGIALATFVIAMLPVIPRFRLLFRSGGMLIFEPAPKLGALVFTLAPVWLLFVYAVALIVAAVIQPREKGKQNGKTFSDWRILLCVCLGIVPILILYFVSIKTPMNVFVPRYRLVAIPGIALCWAFGVSVFRSRVLRLVFCGVLVAVTACQILTSPWSKHHGYTWKYALEFAEKNASTDRSPVVMCSDFPQSDFLPIPVGEELKDSPLFTPVTYYKVSVPVVGMPRTLTDEARHDGEAFLKTATHQRFLAMGFAPSHDTLYWLTAQASDTHDVRQLGTFDEILILEFIPHVQDGAPRQ